MIVSSDDDYDHYDDNDDDSWGMMIVGVIMMILMMRLRHRARWRAHDVVSMYGLAHLAPLIMQSGSYNVMYYYDCVT